MKPLLNCLVKVSFACALIVSLTGCSRTLDSRNAEILSGKIYAKGANTPHTGRVTNLPLTAIPIAGIGPLLAALTNVSGDSAYKEYFLTNTLSAITGGGQSVACDVNARDGVLQGEATCAAAGAAFLKLRYESGGLDGQIAILDPRRSGAVAAEAAFSAGTLNGASKVYDTASGKVLHTVSWKNGVADGNEETRDKSGQLRFKGRIVNGKYDGEAIKYDEKGNILVTTYFKAGVAERNARPGLSDLDNCVEDWGSELQTRYGGSAVITGEMREQWKLACSQGRRWNSPQAAASAPAQAAAAPRGDCIDVWIAAFRKEKGAEAAVVNEQLEEWKGWCAQGKRPA